MQPKPNPLAPRLEVLSQALRARNPVQLAALAGVEYDPERAEFRCPFWGASVFVSFPDGIARDPQTDKILSPDVQALLLFYLTTSDGAHPSGDWISFADLPDGRFYHRAFQGYTGHELAKSFKDDRAAFQRAAENLGGSPQPLGDASFMFSILPKVSLLVVAWLGDDDFPASYQVLFDAALPHYLPTDVCAILGAMLTRRLLRAR